VLVAILVLPFLSRALKRFNKSGAQRARDLREQVTSSMNDVDEAQQQLDAFSAMSAGVKTGMEKAVEAADGAVMFLGSRIFQVGLPAVLWFLLLVIALPRGLRGTRYLARPRRERIPPPSWEAEPSAAE